MEVLQTRIYKVIKSIAVKRDFKLIMGPPVIYADDQVDLTKEVLDVLSREGR